SDQTKEQPVVKADTRLARELYQEADSYLHRRYQEFNKQKLPFDPKLEGKTRQEQRELAAKNAATLQGRASRDGDDLYYLGMLYHLAADSNKAFQTMQEFLSAFELEPLMPSEKAQQARAVVVVHALQKDLSREAEEATEAYAKNQPLNLQELYGLERLLTEKLNKTKDYERMALHAQRMLTVANRAVETKEVLNFKRDEMLFNSASFLAQAQMGLNNKQAAIATLEELRKTALKLPSGNLYKMARNKLISLDPGNVGKPLENTIVASNPVPELVASQWIDQEPTKLADLHGRVVLIDFWAPWCGPCLYTFPKLQKWHETYKDKGLVILGVTNYYGNAGGKTLTPGEELAYLREFKSRIRLSYGFVVADSPVNELNYGVASIPVSFLIDRRGNLRFISVGSSEHEIAALGRMVKKLVDEAPDGQVLNDKVGEGGKNN
ncbi:MAG: redoxin domain-containing protein, partial [Pyrinomonadaceae bacterium]